ncbi:MAG: hypothetical protein O3C21_16955 [Verrucomicrobia bacterium]|nr:hypothetical protein [Verrucomicrobiota bacterium]
MAARKKQKSTSKPTSVGEQESRIRKRYDLRYWIFYAILGGLFIGLLSYAESGADPERIQRRIDERVAEGKPVPINYYIAQELPRAARSNAILLSGCALVALVALRRIRRPELIDPPDPAHANSKLRKVTPFALAGIAGVVIVWSGIANAPRLTSSLWADEEYTMRKFVVGEFQVNESTKALEYVPHTWSEAFFDMHNTNNHVFNTLLAKLSHEFFTKPPTPADDGLYFSEAVLRWPGYVAGLAAIAALTWCLWTVGLRHAAIIAPFLLALHPWYVRYANELRGYTYVLLFTPLAIGLLWNAVRRGHWGWWALYGISQIVLFYSYLGCLHILISLNFAGILWIWFQHQSMREQRWVLTARFALTNLLAAMTLWQLYAPCAPQVRTFMQSNRFKGSITGTWLMDALASLFTGMRWLPFSEENPLALSWHGLLRSSQGVVGLGTLALIATMLGFGIWALAKRDTASRILLIPLLLPAPLFFAQAVAGGNKLYLWYLIIGLPGIIGLLAVGMGEAGRLLRKPAAALAIPILFLSMFSVSTQAQRANYRKHAIEPLQESVGYYRKNLTPLAPENEEVVSLEIFMHPRGYDPLAIRIQSFEKFQEQLDDARIKGRPVFVNLALIDLARKELPEIMDVLDNPEMFTPLGVLYGQDEPCTRHVFRMR